MIPSLKDEGRGPAPGREFGPAQAPPAFKEKSTREMSRIYHGRFTFQSNRTIVTCASGNGWRQLARSFEGVSADTEGERERRALVNAAAHVDLTVVRFDDFAADGET